MVQRIIMKLSGQVGDGSLDNWEHFGDTVFNLLNVGTLFSTFQG